MKKRQFSMLTLCLLIVAMFSINLKTAIAVTAYPHPVDVTQPDGSTLTLLLSGDEFTKMAETLDGYSLLFNSKGEYEYAVLNGENLMVPSGVIAKNKINRSTEDARLLNTIQKGLKYAPQQIQMMRSIKAIQQQEAAMYAFPTTGNRKLVCILMGYKDLAFTKSKSDFNNLFNQVNYSTDGATGSVKDYYIENSHGQLDLSVTVAGPYTAANNMAYYGGNSSGGGDKNPRALVTEAVKLANSDVNYANFDNDGDGSVDGVYIIYAGHGEEAGGGANTIWAHAWAIPTITLDGKRISRYSCSAELRGGANSGSGITRIGVICHEFGHVAGAPDYYDTDYATGGQFSGTGRWDCMAGGSWNNNGATPAHHNAYTKIYKYGWATAKVLTAKQSVSVSDVKSSNTNFYRINTVTTNEYFLIENRQKNGFDAKIPGHGMMIYHVHNGVGSVGNKINATHPQRMYPVCATATSNPSSTPSSYGSINSGGCPFPGSGNRTKFGDATTPNSKSWNGSNTAKPITNITETSGVIKFDFMGGGVTPPVEQTPFGGTPALIPGTIQSVHFDNGGENVAYHDATAGNNGNGPRKDTDVDTEMRTTEGTVGWISTGEWLEYTVNVQKTAKYTVDVQVASTGTSGKFHIEFKESDKTGIQSVASTGNWGTFVSHKVKGLSLTKGKQVMRIYMDGGSFNLASLKFDEEITPPADTESPSVPVGLTASNVTTTSVELSWNASTDNVGVSGYDVMMGNTVLATIKGVSTKVTKLTANTSYVFSIKAKDAAGNISAASKGLNVTTKAIADDGGLLISGATAKGKLDQADGSDMWWIDVPVNTNSMRVVLESGTQDFDTYGKFSSQPTTSSYDWRGYTYGGEDNTINNPKMGRHYIMADWYSGSGDYTIKVTFNDPNPSINNLSDNKEEDNNLSATKMPSSESALKVYPNPSIGDITIEINQTSNVTEVYVLDISGKRIYANSNFIDARIKLNGLNSGIYTVYALENNKIHRQQLIVK